jgi:lipopolysaccharide/colanic/teichoic acid biosynthesis glycosyltransferase
VSGAFTGCSLGETVAFTLAGATVSEICDSGGGAARSLSALEGATATAMLTAPTAAGTYTVTATGATSGATASARLTVVVATAAGDADGLPSTGSDSDRTLWIATAAVVMGLGLVVVAWRRRPAYSPLTPVPSHGGLLWRTGTSAHAPRLRATARLTSAEHALTSSRTQPSDLAYLGWRRYAKRAIELVVIALTLPIIIPVMAIIAMGVKITSRGPVFFRQERVGQHGDVFRMIKFRTMYIDAEDRLKADPRIFDAFLRNDFKVPAAEDPRIVPFGLFLRRSSLDELPQLFNVLSGKMSLVGPRPVFEGQVESYGALAWAYLLAKPGITGEWQTSGRNNVHFPERAQLDAHYLTHWSLHGDLAILLKTAPCVLRGDGTG